MFFQVPTAVPAVQITDQLGRPKPFYLDGHLPANQFNATMVLIPPGNDTGSTQATVDWLNPEGGVMMSRTAPLYYAGELGWAAGDLVPANASAFPFNATHEYAVRITTGHFVGSTTFFVLSKSWISVNTSVVPTLGQWFDPNSFQATFTAQVNTGLPGNPYADVHNLTLQFWNSTHYRDLLANLSWNITGYPVVPGSSYTYTWTGMVPALWIDNSTDRSMEFFGTYSLRSEPAPGMFPATASRTYFYVDDPLEVYTSLERASPSARSAFRANQTIWLNVELDPVYLRDRRNPNTRFADTSCLIIWDWPDPPSGQIRNETLSATQGPSRPSIQYWAFSYLNTTITFPDGFYRIRVGVVCDTGYTVWDWKYFEIYGSYMPPTEDPNRPPYTRISPESSTSWHTIPTTIKLYPADPPPGTGVDKTFYQIDGGQTHVSQTTPTSLQALEGSHTYTYWSEDRAGNAEIPQSALIKVDTRLPETVISPVESQTPYEPPVTVRLTAHDPEPGSGLFKTYYAIDSSEPMEYPIDGFPALEGGHVYSYWSLDNAGNCGARQQAFIEVAIPEGILPLLCLLAAGLLLRRGRPAAI
jgi:hypothetical protein